MSHNLAPIKARALKYADLQSVGKSEFCHKTGISPSLLKGSSLNSELGGEKIANILTAFPEISPTWLILGRGPMQLQDELPSIVSEEISKYEVSEKGVPYYDVDFVGGFDLILNDQTITPEFRIDFPPFNDALCWVNATGGSMYPLISSGDIIALERLKNWKEFILKGETYAVVTQDFRTIKIVGTSQREGHVKLIPYNSEDRYSSQDLPVEMITNLFKVKGAIKKFF